MPAQASPRMCFDSTQNAYVDNDSDQNLYILRDFKNAPFYILCLFHMINLMMFSLSFLSSYNMDHDLPLFRFAHAVHSDVIST